ncbi:anaphase-promoting complex subunit 7, partial [Hetaerina americana]|uniref:anaphase-promoting complex subunit 7 n=1 Tax=Hetaerina americana TaxID=62018 RepID=UPI003A7F2583
MTGIYDHIRQLFDQNLHSNVVSLANFALSASDHNPEMLSATNKLKTYVHYADSLFALGQNRKAESTYRKALLFKKTLMKCKGAKPQQDSQKETISDIDIKYQIHLCLLNLKLTHQAIGVLQTIPGKQRTAKINMALAKLYHQGGLERSAITAYKEVLRECPLAMEAVEGLLSLGVKGAEVGSFMLDGTSTLPNMDWLTMWVRARAHFYAREYTQASSLLRQLDDRSALRDNPVLLVALGECLHHAGDHSAALSVLLRANSLEPHLHRGLDILAALLAGERRLRELERCISPLVAISEYGPETWVAMGYYAHAVRKNAKAVYFAHKACLIDPRNVEALILKGLVLLEMKKWQEAGLHFREAMLLAPHRYEPHCGLADCYIAMHRTREALTVASSACKQLGQTPRALTLYASVLMKDPVGSARAKGLLEKALQQDRTHLPAVYLLAEIYEQEMLLENAVALLKEQVDIQPTCKLHQMLGDLYSRMHDADKALDHYNMSLSLDPNNRRALDGMQRLDVAGSGTAGTSGAPPSSSKLDSSSSYYMSAVGSTVGGAGGRGGGRNGGGSGGGGV